MRCWTDEALWKISWINWKYCLYFFCWSEVKQKYILIHNTKRRITYFISTELSVQKVHCMFRFCKSFDYTTVKNLVSRQSCLFQSLTLQMDLTDPVALCLLLKFWFFFMLRNNVHFQRLSLERYELILTTLKHFVRFLPINGCKITKTLALTNN